MVETSSAQPVVRDHRDHGGPKRDRGPREAPPPIRVETHEASRPGYIWVAGSWEWRGGRWEWTAGRWERERAKQRWREPRWENRGGEWIRVEGEWIVDDRPVVVVRPRQAPPPPQVERPTNRPGYIWVTGQWDWQNGRYVWTAGHYESLRAGQRWREARWDRQGDEWVRVEGGWEPIATAPPPSPYPTAEPPPLREERFAPRAGYIFVRGRWEWRNGQWAWTDGRWERERAKQRWIDGRWERHGDRWEFVEGHWDVVPDYPVQPPPPLQVENPGSRPGYVWMPGNYRWIDGKYVWYAGRWEQARACKRLVAGQWGLRGDRYVFNSEVWVDEPNCRPPGGPATYPTPPPIVPPPVGGPTQAPPSPRDENYGAPRDGYIWARGFYQWKNGAYDWVPGHWERQQAARQWVDAKWELRGNVWVFVEGGWR